MGVRGGPAEPAGRWQRTAQDREWEGEGQVGRGERSMLDAGTIAGERLSGGSSSEAQRREMLSWLTLPPSGSQGRKMSKELPSMQKKFDVWTPNFPRTALFRLIIGPLLHPQQQKIHCYPEKQRHKTHTKSKEKTRKVVFLTKWKKTLNKKTLLHFFRGPHSAAFRGANGSLVGQGLHRKPCWP